MENVLPKLKKKISSYISSETGRISKQSIITIGAFIGTAALATLTAKTVKAGLTAELNPTEGEKINVTGKHVSHASHSVSCNEACSECTKICEYNCQDIGEGCGQGCTKEGTEGCKQCTDQGGCGETPCSGQCSTCESHCQSTCQVSCMYDCETNCQQCQTTCETTCEHVNQNCCQAGCESGVPGLER